MGRALAGSCLHMSNDTKTKGGNGKSRRGSKGEPWSIAFSDVAFVVFLYVSCIYSSGRFYHMAVSAENGTSA